MSTDDTRTHTHALRVTRTRGRSARARPTAREREECGQPEASGVSAPVADSDCCAQHLLGPLYTGAHHAVAAHALHDDASLSERAAGARPEPRVVRLKLCDGRARGRDAEGEAAKRANCRVREAPLAVTVSVPQKLRERRVVCAEARARVHMRIDVGARRCVEPCLCPERACSDAASARVKAIAMASSAAGRRAWNWRRSSTTRRDRSGTTALRCSTRPSLKSRCWKRDRAYCPRSTRRW